jgi:hypothetical protein
MTKLADVARAMPAGPPERREWYWDRLREVDLASCRVSVDIRCGLPSSDRPASPCNFRIGLIHRTPLGGMLVVRRRSEVVFGKRFVVPLEWRTLLNEDRKMAWLEDAEGPAEDGLLEVACSTHKSLDIPRHYLRSCYGSGRSRKVRVSWP